MQFNMWDTVFNLLMLAFWFRIWSEGRPKLIFNPYLAPFDRFSTAALNFLRPVFPGLSGRTVSIMAVAFLILLRAALAMRLPDGWLLFFGFEIRQPIPYSIATYILYSTVSFGSFLFKLFGLSLLFAWSEDAPSLHTRAVLYHLAQPFSRVPLRIRPGVLILIGGILAFLLATCGQKPTLELLQNLHIPGPMIEAVRNMPETGNQSAIIILLRSFLSSLGGLVSILSILIQAVFFLIIISWISLFAGSRRMAEFCQDWLSLILTPLQRFKLRVGMFDLTPIVFLVAVSVLQGIALLILIGIYQGIAS